MHLCDHDGPLCRIWSASFIGLMQSLRHSLRSRSLDRILHFGEKSVEAIEAAYRNDLPDEFRMPDRQTQRDRPAEAVTDDVCILDLELMQQRRGVVHHLLNGHRAVDIACVPMTLL